MARLIRLIAAFTIALALPQPATAQPDKKQSQSKALAKSDDSLTRADDLSARATQLFQSGESASALPLVIQALRLRQEKLGERHPDTLTTLADYAFLLEQVGRIQEAEPIYAEVYQLRREVLGENHPETVRSLGDHGLILSYLGRPAEAVPLFERLIPQARALLGPENLETLVFEGNYGRALYLLGRLAESETILSATLERSRRALGENNLSTIGILAFYGSTLEELGRLEQAEAIHSQALRVRRKVLGDRHPQTLESLNNHAIVLQKLGRFDDAAPLFATAIETSANLLGEAHPTTVLLRQNSAVVLSQLGRREEALAQLYQVLPIQRQVYGPKHPTTLLSVNAIAALTGDLGDYVRASEIYAVALPEFREVFSERHPNTVQLLFNYALATFASNDPPLTLALSRELAGTMRSRAADLGDGGVRSTAQRNRELPTRQKYESLLADALWFNRTQPGLSAELLAPDAFDALQRASAGSASRAVREAAATRFASERGLQEFVQLRQALVREWQEVEAELLANEAGGAASAEIRQDLRGRLETIETQIEAVDQRLSSDAPEFFAILSQQAVTIEELRGVLGDDEAILFLIPTDFAFHSMVVTRDDLAWRGQTLSATEAAEAVAELRDGLEVGGDGFLPLFDLNRAFDLYQQLIAPVESPLQGKSRVYVIAAGAFSRLPLGTLTTRAPTGEALTDDPEVLRNADWLADRYALVQLPSLQSLVFIRSFGIDGDAIGEMSFTGFGAPVLEGEARLRGARSATLDAVDAAGLLSELRGASGLPLMNPEALRSLTALPGTKSELEQVRAALGAPEAALYLAERMTETSIRNADLSQTRILHLATHGFTSEESGATAEPGLVFTPPSEAQAEDDGYLAASEVVGLNLTLAEWVILSACNTASPSGKAGETGLSGLAQAFFYAGAESLLVSHWPVFDDIAPLLTVEALKRSQAGQPRAEALQAAMREIRINPDFDAAHPAVWAPFTLVGEGR